MRAVVITRPGGPDVLEMRDVPRPDPGPGEIRVRVHATAVNRADLLQRVGGYPAPAGVPREIPGLEYAGVVDTTGAGTRRWSPGDRVMGLVGGGSYAEYVVTHEDEAIAIPANLSFEEAAAVPEAFITAHDALYTQMRLAEGETLLVHAVGSGVGTAALQLAKARGARVIGTQRSAWKLERAEALGLDVAIETGSDVDADSFVNTVMEATDGTGVHGVLDLIGGPWLAANVRVLRTRGRILLVGLVAGSTCELDLRRVLQKRATIIGTVLRARPLTEKIEVARRFADDVVPLLGDGRVRPVMDAVLPLEHAAQAHTMVQDNRNFGKVVLRC
ncbi:MAG TPA: NAD(P)H-quinone oxidoreductase [Longimicrobiales bacterium]|nr:NAD(P)H-quinone oxidoreductase [Longimicrobiales bacterium]